MIWMLGIGASMGACVRYFLTNLIKKYIKGPFPLATFFLNVSGTLALGFVVGIKLKTLPYVIIGTGFLGGYTTFSTFNTELFALLDDRNYKMAFLYGILSYVVGLSFAFLGFTLGQHLIG